MTYVRYTKLILSVLKAGTHSFTEEDYVVYPPTLHPEAGYLAHVDEKSESFTLKATWSFGCPLIKINCQRIPKGKYNSKKLDRFTFFERLLLWWHYQKAKRNYYNGHISQALNPMYIDMRELL